MEIKTIESFLSYLERTRQATKRVIQAIPSDKFDFTYMPGKFTVADLVRHIAAVEQYVFANIAVGKGPAYKGCGKELAEGYDAVMQYYEDRHEESINMFKSLSDSDLLKKVNALNGTEIELGNFLRALLVHEIHHRGALCIYINLMGLESPPILGFTEKQVIEVSNK